MSVTAEPITREPLCSVRYCPAPSDYDFHACVHCGSTTIEHHHVEGRGKTRTMDKKKVVPLCVPVHKKISLNEYSDAILDLDGSKLYRIFDLHNETIYEGVHSWMQDPVLSDGAEGGDAPTLGPQVGRRSLPAGTSAPSPSAGAEETLVVGRRRVHAKPSASALKPLDEWCQRGMAFVYNGERLDALTDEWRFQVGDWLNEGEGMMPEEVHGYLRGFRSPMALRQYAWVAGVVTRVTFLSWTHHRAVAALPQPEQQEKLQMALEGGLSSRAMMAVGRTSQERHACPDCGAEHQVKS